MRRNLQRSNLVVEESPHGEPVQRLIASPADAAVVHVSGHCHTQPLLAAPEETVTLIRYRELNARANGCAHLRGARKDFAPGRSRSNDVIIRDEWK